MALITTDPHTSRADSPYKHAIAGATGLAVAMGVGRFAFTPILPVMQDDAGLSVADGGWLAAANYFGYFLGALAALAVGGKASTLIRASLIVTALVTAGMGITASFPAWLALRWVAGFASAFVLVFVSAWSLERLTAAARPALTGLVYSGVGAGIFAVGLLCLALLHAGADSGAMWLTLGAVSLALSVAVWPAYSSSDKVVVTEARKAPEATPGTRWAPLVASYGLHGFGYIIPATFLPVMAKAAVGDGLLFGWSWPVFGFAALVSTFIAAAAARHWPIVRIWRVSQLAMAAGVALPAVWPSFAAVVVAALCVGGAFMVITMAGMQVARSAGGPEPKRLMAAMTAAFAAGQMAGPLAVPYFVRANGDFSTILLVASACLVLGACLLPRASAAYPHPVPGKESAT